MEKKRESDASAKFIQALIKSVQTLCHGYLDFQSGIEIIGHINLSVDKGSSLDYILKEKVCRNAQNSTVYISNSFHAEAKEEEITRRKSDGVQCTESTISIDRREGGKVGYAISSISASLLGKHHHQRGSKESHKSNSKRRSSGDHSGDSYGAKIPHIDSRHDCSPRSKSVQAAVTTDSGNTSETLLPQTAGVGEGCGIGVNLAGSVLEPMGGHNDSDLHHEDEEDSDNDLEVTFIKEEYGAQPHGEDPGGDFEGGPQFGQRGLQDSSAPFVGGSFDQGHQFSAPDGGPSQPGPSGARDRFRKPPKGDCYQPSSTSASSSSSRRLPQGPRNTFHHQQHQQQHQQPAATLINPEAIKTEDVQITEDASGLDFVQSEPQEFFKGKFRTNAPHGESIQEKFHQFDSYGESYSEHFLQGESESESFNQNFLQGESESESSFNQNVQGHFLGESYSGESTSATTTNFGQCSQYPSSGGSSKPSRICPICGKWFYRREYLQDHLNMHNNIKAHQCSHCHRTFTYKRNLWQHVRQGICWKQKRSDTLTHHD